MHKRRDKPPSVRIGVLGGSGLYCFEGVRPLERVKAKTPFGSPSDEIQIGELDGVRFAFLPRHGSGHRLLPSEINARANLYAFKSLGVERVLSVAAVGSLKEELAPRHIVFPDQLVDKTRRISTFFGGGIVGHVGLADPFCRELSGVLYEEASRLGFSAHAGGTYVCIEGPAFSTRAESQDHRRAGYSVIGMTAAPEAKLAREAQLCYSSISLVTDYDVWKDGEEVTMEKVLENLSVNVRNVQKLIRTALPRVAGLPRSCGCGQALANAVFTRAQAMAPAARRKLELLIGRHLKPSPRRS